MKNIKNYFIAALFLLPACKTDKFVPSRGAADFSKYIAIGDSQTAGYANDGLYNNGILASFPAVMAGQMKALGGGEFNQPLFSTDQANGSGYLQLNGYTPTGSPIIIRVTTNRAIRGTVNVPPVGNITLYQKYTGPNNNFGITGMKLADIKNAQFGNTNGYFERLLSGNSPNNNTLYLDYVGSQKFTFFSCWIGNNDVLGFAAAGGASDSLTDKTTFSSLYTILIDRLTEGNQKGVVATIPDITNTPYFTLLTVDSISNIMKKISPSFPGLYINARNTAALSSGYTSRLATKDDLFLLSFDMSQIGTLVSTVGGSLPYGLTPLTPIDNKFVLDKNEVALVKDYIDSYNATIRSVAASKGLALFDVYSYLSQIKQSIVINGVTVSGKYITGGFFSLDGAHLTPRGCALIAEGFNSAINTKYGASLLPADISKFSGN